MPHRRKRECERMVAVTGENIKAQIMDEAAIRRAQSRIAHEIIEKTKEWTESV